MGCLHEREQVVVAGVARAPRRVLWVDRDSCRTGEQRDQRSRIGKGDSLPELRVGQDTVKLGKQLLRDDELESAGDPALEKLCRDALRRERRSDDDVRIEDDR